MVKDKLYFIFLPLLLCSAAMVVLYTFFHWLLLIKLNLFQIKDFYIEFLFPVAIAILIGSFYLRKRIKLFSNERWHDFYTFVCIATLVVPTLIAQNYLIKQQGKLIVMDTPDKIDAQQQARYYSIEEAIIPRLLAGAYITRTNADRNGHKIRITVYLVTPLLAREEILNKSKHNNWIAVTFKKTFSNVIFDNKDIQQKEINEFVNKSIEKFYEYPFNTQYLINLRNDNNWNYYLTAAKKSTHFTGTDNLVILEETNGDYENRMGNQFIWIFYSWLIGCGIWLLITLFSPVFEGDMCFFRFHPKEKKVLETSFQIDWHYIFPTPKTFWATLILVWINALVYIFMLFDGIDLIDPQSDELIRWGASFSPLIKAGEWWRLFTGFFLHAGLMHVFYNLVALYLIGLALESAVGGLKYLIIYLICGIASSYCSFMFHDSTVIIGASGAICGIYGLGFALCVNKYLDDDTKGGVIVIAGLFTITNLVVGLLSPGIDMISHIAGMACGFLIGLVFFSGKARVGYRYYRDRKVR